MVAVELEHWGSASAPMAGTGERRRLQVEDCSSDCLRSEDDPCENWPDCEFGGIGCNAQNDPLCRYCGSAPYEECTEDSPSADMGPTPSPTELPDREECSSVCLEVGTSFPCYDDPTCLGGDNLVGCNAYEDFFCRFCGFQDYLDCPDTPALSPAPTTTATPASAAPMGTPTLSPALTPTLAPSLATTPAPTTTATPASTAPMGAPTLAPTLGTVAPVSLAPTTVAPATLSPTLGQSLAPGQTEGPAQTSAPGQTLAPNGSATSAPSASPTSTRAPTANPTAARTLAPTASSVGDLGPASMRGSFSASGVPDELVAEKGQVLLVQETVCAMYDCPNGTDSVIVSDAIDEATTSTAESQAMLLSLSSSEGRRGRRRLADFVDVQFEVPAQATDGNVTGSKQAATLFNSVADPTARVAAADTLGITTADIGFGDLVYYEGAEFEIVNEFDSVVTVQDDDEEASVWATVLVAFILLVAMCLCSCCVLCVVTRGGATFSKQQKGSAIEGEDSTRVHKSRMTANRSMQPSARGTIVHSTSADSVKGGFNSAVSGVSDGTASLEKPFTYTNPMLKSEGSKKTGSPNEYGDDLAQHYERGYSAESSTSDPPHTQTSNPLFSNPFSISAGGSSFASAARSGQSRGGGGGAGTDSQASWNSATTSDDMEPGSPSSSYNGGETEGGAGSSVYDSVSSAGHQHGSRRVGTMSTLSETSSRMPYGLSPVAEKMGEKGESSDMSSNTTGGGGSVHHARGSGSYSGRDSTPTAAIAPRGRGEGSTEFDDEDAEAMLRAPSPGSVKRPLQPLLAQYSQSPVSLSSASAFGSRSGSFASPKERHSVRAEPQETTSARLDAPGGVAQGTGNFTVPPLRHVRGTSERTAAGISEADFRGSGGSKSFVSVSEEGSMGGSSPGAALARNKPPMAGVGTSRAGSGLSHVSDSASEASADAAGGRGSGSGSATGRSATVEPSAAIDEDRDVFQSLRQDRAVPTTTTAAANRGRGRGRGGASKSLRFTSRGRAGRQAAAARRGSGTSGTSAFRDGGSDTHAPVVLTPATSSIESSTPASATAGTRAADDAASAVPPPPAYRSLDYSSADTNASSAVGAAAATSALAAQECRNTAIEAGTAAAGAAVARGEIKSEAQLLAAGAAAAAKATKGRPVPDDVRRKAIQAGAAAAAAVAAQAEFGGHFGSGGPYSSGGSDVKSVLKTSSLFRSSSRPLSVSFVDANSSDEYDDLNPHAGGGGGAGGMRALRQHLADPSQPSGSYRNQDSADSSGFSNESLSPSDTSSFDGMSSYGAPSQASFATGTSMANTNYSTGTSFASNDYSSTGTATTAASARGRRGGGGGGGGGGSQHSAYSFRRVSSESSLSDSDIERPLTARQQRDAGGGGAGAGAAAAAGATAGAADEAAAIQRPLSWTSTAEMEEEEEEAAAARAAATAAAGGGGGGGGRGRRAEAAAAVVDEGAEGSSAVAAYKKMFAAGDRSNSGEAKRRRMVMP